MQLTNIASWREKFVTGAERQLDAAREAIRQGDFSAARQSIQRALAILPHAPGATELLAELKRRAPQVAVGVAQVPITMPAHGLATWAHERVGRLTNPQLVELVRVGSEGGEYACRWAEIKSDESGLRLELRFNESARVAGITPDGVALQLLRMADSNARQFRSDFASAFASAEIIEGHTLLITWRHAHVKPEALLQFPLSDLQRSGHEPIAYSAITDADTLEVTSYRVSPESAAPVIREELFMSDEQALDALRKGDLDVLDQVPPWQLAKVKQEQGLTVGTYRMPTVHVLLCNFGNPLLNRREFRRALCYAIDRPRLVTRDSGRRGSNPRFSPLERATCLPG